MHADAEDTTGAEADNLATTMLEIDRLISDVPLLYIYFFINENVKLSETVKILRDKCFGFATQCIARLKDIFNSVGVVSEKVIHSTEDILGAIECVEKEKHFLKFFVQES
ncbi:hypothetical protein ACJX0J_037504, partial [Zea mays]